MKRHVALLISGLFLTISACLQQAKTYADQRPEQPPLILINA